MLVALHASCLSLFHIVVILYYVINVNPWPNVPVTIYSCSSYVVLSSA